MRVANVAYHNLCNIGTSLSRGLRARGHDARSIVLEPSPYETDADLLWSRDKATCREVLDASEVLHLNSFLSGFTLDFVRTPFGLARSCRGKRVVLQYHGTDLRMKVDPSVRALIARHRIPVFVTVPDLLPEIAGSEWLPIPLDPDDPMYAPGNPPSSPIRICHAPTMRAIKKTEAFLEAVALLRRAYDVEPVLIEGLPYAECLAVKRKCHINFDNIGFGSYALGSAESMMMEQPSLVYLNEACKDQILRTSELLGLECPLVPVGAPHQPSHAELVQVMVGHRKVAHTQEDVTSIYRALEPLVKDDNLRREIGRRGRRWTAAVHDERRVASIAEGAYDRAPVVDGFSLWDRLEQSAMWALGTFHEIARRGRNT
jgi:hypothetical protein